MARVNMQSDPNVGSAPPPVPAGRYLLACTAVEDGKSKQAGHPQAVLTIAVEEGEYVGRKLGKTWVTFIPKGESGHWIGVQAAQAFGLVAKGASELDIDTDDFRGRSAWADVGLTADGKYNQVERWIVADEEPAAPPPSAPKPAPAARPAAPASPAARARAVPF